jgi:polysaccharide export outer membrane protein
MSKTSAATTVLAACLMLCALAALTGPARAAPPMQMAKALPPPDATANAIDSQLDYRIGPLDTLEVTVFQVTYLDHPIQVGADGHISLPLIGDVAAAGRTPRELGAEIARQLGQRYLQSPQVTVSVKDAVSQKFTVEGQVTKPGMYSAVGDMTLLDAVALAEGATQYANMHKVAVFRTVNSHRVGAVYDLAAIHDGKRDDPQIYGGDVVVVGGSAVKQFLRDIAPLSPFMALRP